jgi:hypothetical protein
VFLLPAIFLGLVFALVVGGKLSRLAQVRLRLTGLVLLAFATQVFLFTGLGSSIPEGAVDPLHVGTYGLLVLFALARA